MIALPHERSRKTTFDHSWSPSASALGLDSGHSVFVKIRPRRAQEETWRLRRQPRILFEFGCKLEWKSGASMNVSVFDRQAWLDRIGYDGSLEPTLETLHRLIFAHSHTISYESLDIMLGRTPKLDLASLQRKMISGGRGG